MIAAELPSFPFATLPPIPRRYVEANAANLIADPSAVALAYLAAASGVPPPGVALQVGAEVVEPRLWVLVVGAETASVPPEDLDIIERCVVTLQQVECALKRKSAQAWQAWSGRHGDKPAPSRELVYCGEVPISFFARAQGGLVVCYELLAWLRAGAVNRQAHTAGLLGVLERRALAELHDLAADGAAARLLPVLMRPMKDLAGALPVETVRQLALQLGDSASVDEYVVAGNDAFQGSYTLLRELAQLPLGPLELDPAAGEIIAEFQARARGSAEGERARGFGAFLAALPGAVGSLTLLLHLLTHGREARNLTVDAVAAEAAVQILETFVIPHAQAAYGEAAP
jgi:hypothetical protein